MSEWFALQGAGVRRAATTPGSSAGFQSPAMGPRGTPHDRAGAALAAVPVLTGAQLQDALASTPARQPGGAPAEGTSVVQGSQPMTAPENRDKLGEGGDGVVYEGMIEGVRVAIKRLKNPGNSREAKILAAFQGPGVVPLLGVAMGELGWVYDIVTKFANLGPGTKQAALGQFKSMRELLRCMGRGGVGALARMHAQGWIHRDIKPNNFVFHQEGGGEIQCWLIDFGRAVQLKPDGSYLGGKGSKPFAKRSKWPEHVGRGLAVWDIHDDVHALGVTLLFMACGVHWDQVKELWKRAACQAKKGRHEQMHAVENEVARIVRKHMMPKWNHPTSIDVINDMHEAAHMFLLCCPHNTDCRNISGEQPSLSSIVSFLNR